MNFYEINSYEEEDKRWHPESDIYDGASLFKISKMSHSIIKGKNRVTIDKNKISASQIRGIDYISYDNSSTKTCTTVPLSYNIVPESNVIQTNTKPKSIRLMQIAIHKERAKTKKLLERIKKN